MALRYNLNVFSCFGDGYKSARVVINIQRYKGHNNKMTENQQLPKDFCALIGHLFTLQGEFERNHAILLILLQLYFFLLHIGPEFIY